MSKHDYSVKKPSKYRYDSIPSFPLLSLCFKLEKGDSKRRPVTIAPPQSWLRVSCMVEDVHLNNFQSLIILLIPTDTLSIPFKRI